MEELSRRNRPASIQGAKAEIKAYGVPSLRGHGPLDYQRVCGTLWGSIKTGEIHRHAYETVAGATGRISVWTAD